MLVRIKHNILIALCKLNVVYPKLLGFGYWYYKNVFLKKNLKSYNPEHKLLKIVNTAIKNVPYYRDRYKEINSLSDFKSQIKFIDKDEVMGNWENFIASGTSKSKIITGTTGGTSGKPLKLVIPKNRYVFELGTMYTMWENVGWKGQVRAVLRNTKLDDNKNFIVNPIKREFVFDGFRTSDSHYEMVYQTMKAYKIKYLHAYPSSAYQFSKYLYRHKKDVSFIKAFLCGSEGVLPEQTHLISDKMGISIYHWYGHSEKLILGGYCYGSDLIHIEPTYGYFELINEHGNQVHEIGEIGEIVGTTLHNPFMPLIRYKTGDYAEYAGDYCEHCNRHLPLLRKVYGRWDKNKIYKSDGTFITTTALNLHSEIYNKIEGIQYVQKSIGELIVKIIRGENFDLKDKEILETHYKNAFGEENKVEIIFVETLEKLPNGKFINLISEIN
ncbi:hypothetical protein [Winogradskyella poriferorum]|uniref:hypothetical protein n=1 Tax=Winogradskyella poriferorum TaxID=307627 RepID=UPI003D64F17B